MQKEEKIILDTDDAAARFVTGLSGWVDSNNRYFGKDERMARYSGSTHKKCEECDNPARHPYTHCEACRRKRSNEKYNALPFVEWDGKTPLVIWQDDTYFFNEDDIYEYCEDHECKSEELMLVICKPIHLSQISEDIWNHDLAEEQEIPAELRKKVNQLNEFIKTLPPSAWEQGKEKTTVTLDVEKSI